MASKHLFLQLKTLDIIPQNAKDTKGYLSDGTFSFLFEEPFAMNADSTQIGVITVALFQIPNFHMTHENDPSERGRACMGLGKLHGHRQD